MDDPRWREGPSEHDESGPSLAVEIKRDERIRTLIEELRGEIARKGKGLTIVDLDRAATRNALDPETGALLLVAATQAGLIDDASPSLSIAGDYFSMPLLTPAEEVQLARAIEAGEAARVLLGASQDPAAREGLHMRVMHGDAAFDRFVRSNTRLVLSIARRHDGHGLELVDLIQEGVLGLMIAVRRFDWRLGYKFSTYATWWIRQSIGRAIDDKGRTIRIPVHAAEKMRLVRRTETGLARRLARDPTLDELANELGMDTATVAFLLDLARDVVSLDEPIDASGHTLRELIPMRDEPIEDSVIRREGSAVVVAVLNEMPKRERQVLIRRYGIGTEAPETLEAIGSDMGLTRERIRQIQVKAEKTFRKLFKDISRSHVSGGTSW